jgi:hypothetical protein
VLVDAVSWLPLLLVPIGLALILRFGVFYLLTDDKLVIFMTVIPLMIPYERIVEITPFQLWKRWDFIFYPTWLSVRHLWGPALLIETNSGFVRRFVVSPGNLQEFEEKLRLNVDKAVDGWVASQRKSPS